MPEFIYKARVNLIRLVLEIKLSPEQITRYSIAR